MKQLQVLIIGCGGIGGSFDFKDNANSIPLTHAGAFTKDKRFFIRACIDKDKNKLISFKNKWKIPYLACDLSELNIDNGAFDVVSICTPTETHSYYLNIIKKINPKLVFCEKPISHCFDTATNLVNDYIKNNIKLAINYTRRWDPSINEFKDELTKGKWGKVISVNCIYTKGILNNGSHLIDLLIYLLGSLRVTGIGLSHYDSDKNDPSIAFMLSSNEEISICVNIANSKFCSIFSLEFITEFGVINIDNGGLEWRKRKIEESNIFIGYKTLNHGQFIKGKYEQAMVNAVNNIYESIVESKQLNSTGETALQSHKICNDILTRNKYNLEFISESEIK